MTQGIGGYGGGNWDRWHASHEPESPLNKVARGYCTHADSVISGALCDEKTVIADACRAGRGPVDQTLCDDKQLEAAQHGVWDMTKDLLKMIFGGVVSKAAK